MVMCYGQCLSVEANEEGDENNLCEGSRLKNYILVEKLKESGSNG